MFEVNIPTVKSFLYFFSLRNGVKILGWAFLVGHIVAMFETPMRALTHYHDCNLLPLYEDPDTGSHVCPDWLLLELLTTLVADWTITILQILTAFLLLLGAYQTRPRLIFQWIVLQIIMLICDIILTNLSYLREEAKYNMNYFYLYYISWIGFEIYGIYICYCYYMSVISDPAQNV